MNLIGIVSEDKIKGGFDSLTQSINLSGNFHVESVSEDQILFAVAYRKDSPLKGERLFENETWYILFAGDIIEYESIPFEELIEVFEQERFSSFKEFNGYFSIVACNKDLKKVFIVSDRRSQHPIFYSISNRDIYISTDPASFCRLNSTFCFNEEWLWEYMFFNFAIADSSILKGVKRMLPASIIVFDRNSGKHEIKQYANIFKKKDILLDEKEALAVAAEIFGRRVPKYFEGATEIASALTNGWDGRTIIALAPNSNITAYTYGLPNCSDMKGAKKTAELSQIKHKEVPFDDRFTGNLPHLMLETVYLSSGIEKILRASMLYVYGELTGQGRVFPLTTSGIAISGTFRGHMLTPEIISSDVARLMEGRKEEFRENFWSFIFNKNFSSFQDHIVNQINELKNTFGDFHSTEHHLSYLTYLVYPMHFCGEIKIANNFTTVRVPGWDSEITDLAYSIEQSALSFSERSRNRRGGRDEVVLQSYILNKLSPRFAKIPVANTRPDIVLKGHLSYRFYRVMRAILNRAGDMLFPKTRTTSLDEWWWWVNKTHKVFIDGLIFSKDSRIKNYVNDRYLDELKHTRVLQDIGKLATTEIILRLIETNWTRFW